MRTDQGVSKSTRLEIRAGSDEPTLWRTIEAGACEAFVFVLFLTGSVALTLMLGAAARQAWLWLAHSFF